MSRNLTPRMVKAAGAKDAHGGIFDAEGGALYVHMHRELGLAHRQYVLKPWQVRMLAIFLSRPMVLLYVAGAVMWFWMAAQAVRIPILEHRIGTLTRDAERLDTLTATLAELQARYDQVQRMLSTNRSIIRPPAARPEPRPDTTKKAALDTTKRPAPDTTKKPASDTTKRPEPESAR